MYSIKIMSGEDLADSDIAKGFKMILVAAGDTFEFGHNAEGEPIVTITTCSADERTGSSIEYPLTGNAYVMSETGKTVASFWARKKQTVQVILDALDPDPEQTIANIKSILLDYAKRSYPIFDEIESINVTMYTDTEANRGFSWTMDNVNVTDAITDTTDVTKYNAVQREKIYRTRVANRVAKGATQVEAMTAEARWIAPVPGEKRFVDFKVGIDPDRFKLTDTDRS